MATRKPMSEETKKKISEALKKNGGVQKAAVNSIGGVMEQEYNSLENGVSGLKDEYEKLPKAEDINAKYPVKKGATKAEKAAVKAKRDEEKAKVKLRKEQIKNEVKAKRAEQKKIREAARAMKKVKAAEAKIAKAQLKYEKADKVSQKIAGLKLKAKTPEQKQRIADMESRLVDQRKAVDDYIASQQQIISSGGAVEKESMFNFSECIKFAEVTFYRELTTPEKRVGFVALNEKMDELEASIYEEIEGLFTPEIERVSKQVEKTVSAGDMVTAAVIGFYVVGKLKNLIKEAYIESYNYGKKGAAKELEIKAPETPMSETQWINGQAERTAYEIVETLDRETQQQTQFGIVKGLAAAVVATSVLQAARDRINRYAKSVSANLIGEAINEGRKMVFNKNQGEIVAFQRSEILDSRTCDICRGLDGKSVKINDPFANSGQIHSNCRGIWVPIFSTDDPVKINAPKKFSRAAEKVMSQQSIPIKNNILKALKDEN